MGRESANSPPPPHAENYTASASLKSPPELAFPAPRPGRPALVVSSTSWTPDEDFGLLLDALKLYEAAARRRDREVLEGVPGASALPKVLVVVTGKGPLRDKYMREVEKLQNARDMADGKQEGWKWVRCISLWLKAEDYPVFLGVPRRPNHADLVLTQIIRVGGSWSLPAFKFIKFRLADEGGGHVWVRITCLRAQL